MKTSEQVRVGVAVVALGAAAVAWPPALVERWFATGLYPPWQRGVTTLSNLVPVPWLDVLIVAALVWLGRLWWRALRPPGPRRRRAGQALLSTAAAAAGLYLVFLGSWGLNYQRVPVSRRLSLDSVPVTTDAVVRVGEDAAAHLNALHGAAAALATHAGESEMAVALGPAAATVQRQLGQAAPAVPARLKRSLLGQVFRWNGVDAMTSPFGLEVLVNPDLLAVERPFVAAHEWAHLAGYAVEAEASFVGWLTCLRGDPLAQYSGWLALYWQVVAEVPPARRAALQAMLEAGPRADMAAIAARLRRGELPRLRLVSWVMYDRYLKANRVPSGVESYGEVVSLVVRARRGSGARLLLLAD